ncbi:hypothetical protein ACFFP0_00685 [Rhizobium puerariae]|uniref:ArsR family transcriptional regulator n=1 Tax=Rhizobium puerariae TaxID=1585791 RepID=A0ABV6A9Y0_9HYPH
MNREQTMISNEKDLMRKIKTEYQKLEILRGLADDSNNGHILAELLERYGMYANGDQIAMLVNSLESLGLVRSEQIGEYLTIHLTGDGERVAQGKHFVEGIARPDR